MTALKPNPYPDDSYTFKDYYRQEIGGHATKNYKQEISAVLKEIKGIEVHELLLLACDKGYFAIVASLFEKEPELIKLNNYAALRWAAEYGQLELLQSSSQFSSKIEIVKFLYEKDPKGVSADDYKALACAALRGHLETVKFLYEKDPKGVSAYNYRALSCAGASDNLETVKFLYEKDPKGFHEPWYPAQEAAKYGRLEIVKFLYEKLPSDDFLQRITFLLLGEATRYMPGCDWDEKIKVIKFLSSKL